MDSLWKRINKILQPTEEDKVQSLRLLKEYENRGYLHRLNRELLELSLPVLSDFFYRLSLLHSSRTPVLRRRDSRWLADCDVTSFNIRAASTSTVKADFIRASILLPAMRTQAVQLASFTEAEPEAPNRLLSHSKIAADLVNNRLAEEGITPEEQLSCFLEAAHLCGMVTGFDLTCYLSRDSEALYKKPEMFRWIELDRTQGYIPVNHLSYNEMISDTTQQEIAGRIRIRASELERELHHRREINRQLRREGFFPVPMNQDRHSGIPLFIAYDPEREEAIFTGSSETSGQTAFRFYRSGAGEPPIYQKDSIDYFSRIFPLWRKGGFDFLYLEGAISALTPEQEENPPEGPDRQILKEVVEKARKGSKRSGVIASGYIHHLEEFLDLGFDTLLDQDDPLRLDKAYMERSVKLQKELKEINRQRQQPASLLSRISLAEHNSPSFNQKVHLEHYCCRFMNCGKAGRRKFEMMGINDGSAGYSQSLREKRPLLWREDRVFLEQYHCLEDIYQRHKPTLLKGEIVNLRIEDYYAWWIIQTSEELLVAVVSVENDEMIPPPLLEIPYESFFKRKHRPTILEYDFRSPTGNLVLSMTGPLEVPPIAYRGYRLYSIK